MIGPHGRNRAGVGERGAHSYLGSATQQDDNGFIATLRVHTVSHFAQRLLLNSLDVAGDDPRIGIIGQVLHAFREGDIDSIAHAQKGGKAWTIQVRLRVKIHAEVAALGYQANRASRQWEDHAKRVEL